jgi:integrase/recombinase XerD
MSTKATFSFYLNKFKKEKNEKWPIYMRLNFNRKKKELDTGYYASVKEWNDQSGRSKSNGTTNEGLSTLELRFYERLTAYKKAGEHIELDCLKDYVSNASLNASPPLITYIEQYCAKTKLRTDIGQPTKSRFMLTKQTVIDYLKGIQKTGISISEVDFKFIDGYDTYLRSHVKVEPNTLAKYHSRFRTICLKAKNEGLLQANPYASFKIRTLPTNRGYLTNSQIEDIEKLDLNNDSLEKVRDVFLFSVYTSLRFSDVTALTPHNIYEDTEKQLNLKFVIEKSGEQISLPLLDKPIEILNKYAGSDERHIRKTLLPAISNQKTNTYLKVIGDLAGIPIKLTYHVARHTFATTIWLGNGGSIQELQKILGHQNIRETMIYSKISSELLKSSFAKINSKLKK